MNEHSKTYFIAWRFYLVISLLALAVSGLLWRVFDLTVLDQPFLRHQGDQRALRLVSTPSFRGMIVDRNGFPLAISTEVYSIWINPQDFAVEDKDVSELSQILGMRNKELDKLVARYKDLGREFAYIKRNVPPDVANKIKVLNIPGVYLQQEYKRFYPEGEISAHVVGFTNIDDKGQEGLELAYNNWLAGEPGKKWVTKDRRGHVIEDVKLVQEQKSGHDLTLSIDRRLQYVAYRELMAGVLLNKARSGSAIILDSKTGEILAMANYPSYNPNRRPSGANENMKNRAITDLFEPGSTMKAFSAASAISTGKFTPNTLIDTSPGWMRVGRNIVKDHNNNGPLTVTQILQVSSNVGIAKMVLGLPPSNLWNLLHQVGFGESTEVGFPGEPNGSLVNHPVWGQFTLATLSFGYGLSVTTLQLARAYNVLANAGIKKPVSLLRLKDVPAGTRVMDAKVANQMLTVLESVVSKGGSAEAAHISGYRVSGKTGTSKMAGEHGYQGHHYVSSFVGIAPASNPRLVVAVVLHDPQGKQYYGGWVSGPIFEKIMEGTLRTLNIPPDDEMPTSNDHKAV